MKKLIYSVLLFCSFVLRADFEPVALLQGTFEKHTMQNESFKEDQHIQINITKENREYRLSGMAAYTSARSTAPDFEGSCIAIRNGAFIFSFEDSFGNKGTASIRVSECGINFSVTITEIKDHRSLSHYGSHELIRIK